MSNPYGSSFSCLKLSSTGINRLPWCILTSFWVYIHTGYYILISVSSSQLIWQWLQFGPFLPKSLRKIRNSSARLFYYNSRSEREQCFPCDDTRWFKHLSICFSKILINAVTWMFQNKQFQVVFLLFSFLDLHVSVWEEVSLPSLADI